MQLAKAPPELVAKKWLDLPKAVRDRHDPEGEITKLALDILDEVEK